MKTRKEPGKQGEDASKRRKAGMLACCVLAAGLALAPKGARADSVEWMAGNKNNTGDLKASGAITEKVGVFTRFRPTVDYKGTPSTFGVADLLLGLGHGFDAVSEVRFAGGKVIPRGGVSYTAKTASFCISAVASLGLDSEPYFESLTNVRYTPDIYRSLKLLMQGENITDLSAAGHDSSKQRLRLGLELRSWGAGAGLDLLETGNKPDFGVWNAGGFVSKKF